MEVAAREADMRKLRRKKILDMLRGFKKNEAAHRAEHKRVRGSVTW
jgi:hypothetical protein